MRPSTMLALVAVVLAAASGVSAVSVPRCVVVCADTGCTTTVIACQPFSATLNPALSAAVTANNGVHLKTQGNVIATLSGAGTNTGVYVSSGILKAGAWTSTLTPVLPDISVGVQTIANAQVNALCTALVNNTNALAVNRVQIFASGQFVLECGLPAIV